MGLQCVFVLESRALVKVLESLGTTPEWCSSRCLCANLSLELCADWVRSNSCSVLRQLRFLVAFCFVPRYAYGSGGSFLS